MFRYFNRILLLVFVRHFRRSEALHVGDYYDRQEDVPCGCGGEGAGSTSRCSRKEELTTVGGITKQFETFSIQHYGEYQICKELLPESPPVVLSIGLLEDSSFERDMIERFGAEVWVFDPTPAAAKYVSNLYRTALNESKSEHAAHWTERFHYEPLAVGAEDGEQIMVVPKAGVARSGRLVDKQEAKNYPSSQFDHVSVKVLTLEHLMQRIAKPVDILKLDVEGAEYAILEDMLRKPGVELPWTQFLVEFHGSMVDGSFKKRAQALMCKLRCYGFRALLSKEGEGLYTLMRD